jgi:V8-like Glu-specific endopeptidase
MSIRFFMLVVLGCFAGCSSNPADTDTLRLEIVGGTETEGWPAVGAYLIDGGDGGLCTATLVRPDVLLTAAHCADDHGNYELWNNVADVWGSGTTGWVIATEVVIHPLYEVVDSSYAHDMAVLLLDEPITDIQYIPVNTENVDYTWQETWLHFVGYGSDSYYGGPGSGSKRETDVQIYDYYPETLITYTAGTNTCTGDSGGPAFVERDGNWYVAGVVSSGFAWNQGEDSCHGAGVQMRVDHELDFLSEFFDPYETPYEDVGDDDDSDTTVGDDDDSAGAEGEGCSCSLDAPRPAVVPLLGWVALWWSRRWRLRT